jgi:hypothetical protein
MILLLYSPLIEKIFQNNNPSPSIPLLHDMNLNLKGHNVRKIEGCKIKELLVTGIFFPR